MKTKRYFLINIWMSILLLILLGVCVSAICVVLFSEFTHDSLIILIGAGVFFWLFLMCATRRIVLRQTHIFMPSDLTLFSEEQQFKTKIDYSEILDIRLIRSHLNSLGQEMIRHPAAIDSPYIEFTCKGRRKKRICISCINKKRLKKLLDEIKYRMAYNGNNIELRTTEQILLDMTEPSSPLIEITDIIFKKKKKK